MVQLSLTKLETSAHFAPELFKEASWLTWAMNVSPRLCPLFSANVFWQQHTQIRLVLTVHFGPFQTKKIETSSVDPKRILKVSPGVSSGLCEQLGSTTSDPSKLCTWTFTRLIWHQLYGSKLGKVVTLTVDLLSCTNICFASPNSNRRHIPDLRAPVT